MDIQTEAPIRWSRPEGSDHGAGDEGSEGRVLDGVGSDEGFAVLK